MKPPLLYPERKRCRACRGYLDDLTVVEGLYCSLACSTSDRAIQPTLETPRECRTIGPRNMRWKKRYVSLRQIDESFLNKRGAAIYRCGNCGFLHIGHDHRQGAS